MNENQTFSRENQPLPDDHVKQSYEKPPQEPASPRNTAFNVYLVGDPGAVAPNNQDPVIDTLSARLADDPKATVAYLGDILYPEGLPPKDHRKRELMEGRLKTLLDPLIDHEGEVIVIPGNHDFKLGLEGGESAASRLEDYINTYMHRRVFLPPNGCPGPVVIDQANLRMIVLNSEWWLQKGPRPIGDQYGCRAESGSDVFVMLEAAIANAQPEKQVLVMTHSPLYSDAVHGGRFKWHHHLFPFRVTRKQLWIPLPFLGTLINLYRRIFGMPEDISHPRFRLFRKRMLDVFSRHPGCIYASGHEHNLQHIEKRGTNYLVSGSASKKSYVRPRKHSKFASPTKGFMQLRGSAVNGVELLTIVPDTHQAKGRIIYQSRLKTFWAPKLSALSAVPRI